MSYEKEIAFLASHPFNIKLISKIVKRNEDIEHVSDNERRIHTKDFIDLEAETDFGPIILSLETNTVQLEIFNVGDDDFNPVQGENVTHSILKMDNNSTQKPVLVFENNPEEEKVEIGHSFKTFIDIMVSIDQGDTAGFMDLPTPIFKKFKDKLESLFKKVDVTRLEDLNQAISNASNNVNFLNKLKRLSPSAMDSMVYFAMTKSREEIDRVLLKPVKEKNESEEYAPFL